MLSYSKTSANAIATMSYLAQIYEEPVNHAGSRAIAEARELSQPLVAKIMTTLSTAGLVHGSPGPGGGYKLALHPAEIKLVDIIRNFERLDTNARCPYGENWCGNGPQCPLHDQLLGMSDQLLNFMECTTLDVFLNQKQPATQ